MQRIIVNVKNEVGVLAEIATLLAESGVNIVGIDAEGSDETGVIVITTEDADHDKALLSIANAGYRAISEESIVFRLPDEPGALAKVADRFRRANINILSIHILNRSEGFTTVSISAEDQAKASELVADELITNSSAK